MTKKQLDYFTKRLGSYNDVERRILGNHEYLFIWYLDKDQKRYALSLVFVLYENTCVRRYEIDGFLRAYTLNALEEALKIKD